MKALAFQPRIAVLINEFDHVYHAEVLRGLRRAAEALKVHLLCFAGGELATPDAFRQEFNLMFKLAGRVAIDGIVSVSGAFAWSATAEEQARFFDQFSRVPIISMGDACGALPAIKPDNRTGMGELVDHFLLHHGFTRIAFIAGPEDSEDARERLAEFRERLARAGLEVDEDLLLPGSFDHRDGRRAVERLYQKGLLPEAIIAASDEMALSAIDALIEYGLRVPEDVAVGGFDDLAAVLEGFPPLSSVRQDVAGQAELSLRLLVAHICDGTPLPDEVRLPTRAIVRHSCGCSALSHRVTSAMRWEAPAGAERQIRHLRTELERELCGESGRLHAAIAEAIDSPKASQASIDDINGVLQVLMRDVARGNVENTPRALSLLLAEQTWLNGHARLRHSGEMLESMFPSWPLSNILKSPLPGSEFQLQATLDFLRGGLLGFGVPNAYLVVFTRCGGVRRWNDCDLPERAQLVLAIRDGVPVELSGFPEFPTCELLPFPVFHEPGAALYSVLPVFQKSEHYGYLILDIGRNYRVRVEQLRAAMANLIAGAMVVGEPDRQRESLCRDLSWQAGHDALTGLANRREFERRLARALEHSKDTRARHSVIHLDLDQFKLTDDTSGHEPGDRLLCEVAASIQQRLRDGDTLARLGGNEFGVLLENCPEEPALRIAESLRRTVEALQFCDAGRSCPITASLGLVCVGAAMLEAGQVLRAADIACYLAKEKGRNRVQRYDPNDTDLSRRFGEMAWVERIHRALDEQRFVLYRQDIVPLGAGGAGGTQLEVLVRLKDESGRLVPPGEFIPAAERFGLVSLIDRWVTEKAVSTLAEHERAGGAPIEKCSINLSGATVGDEAFVEFLQALLDSNPVAPQRICFEVTETAAIADLDRANRFIRELQRLGCSFALDDFGAGMSSFGYLRQLPVDYLKIDGSFVRNMESDAIDYAMVEMIAHIAQMMGKRTVAEFVENPRILKALAQIGVDYAQGYALAKPRPFSAPTTACA